MYVIKGKYSEQPWEDIDIFDTRDEAIKMLAEYRMAYGAGWIFALRRRYE